MFQIPYNKYELIGVLQDAIKKTTEEVQNKIIELCNKYELNNKKEKNKKVAEFNGITVNELINSTNYKLLIQEYESEYFDKVIKLLKSEGLTTIEAYSIIAYVKGSLSF